MKNTAVSIATLVLPLLGVALVTQSCGGGESVGNSTAQSGGSDGSGGSATGTGNTQGSGSGTGGSFISVGSGGANVNQSSGGSTSSGSGGTSSGSASGGASASSTGGTSVILGAASGGSPVTGGGGSATTGGGMDSTFATNGYGMNSVWMGYVYTGVYGKMASITANPPGFMTGKQLCVSGTVGVDPLGPGNSGAILGWSINQQKGTTAVSPAVNTVAPSGSGLHLELTAVVPGMRVTIQVDPAGAMQWCYVATGTSMMIPWGMFNKTCYGANDPSTAFSPTTPISAISVEVVSGGISQPFNFCLINAAPYP